MPKHKSWSERRAARRAARAAAERGTAEPETPQRDPFLPPSEEELDQELSDIRDMFQTEIDRLRAEQPEKSWNEIVKEAAMKKKDSKAAEPAEKTIAEPAAEAVSADEAAAENPGKFTWWSFLIPVIALFFLAFAVLFTVQGWSLFSGTASAQKCAMENRTVTALSRYQTINNLIDQSGGRLTYGSKYRKNQVKLYRKLGVTEMEQMNSFIATHYTPKELKSPSNHYAKKAQEQYNEYNAAATALQTAMQSSASSAKSAKDFYQKTLTAFNKSVEGKDSNVAYTNFFRWWISTASGQKPSVQKGYIDAIRKEGRQYKNLYLPLYAEYSLNRCNWDDAISYSDKILRFNKEDSYSYAYKAYAQRMQNKMADAEETLTNGLSVDNTSGPINYQMAVYQLLKGNYAAAEEYALSAVSYQSTAENINLYALTAGLRAQAAKKSGDKKTYQKEQNIYKEVTALLKNNNEEVYSSVTQILSGKKTVKSVFMTGKGVLS